jgi:hypothetical protein
MVVQTYLQIGTLGTASTRFRGWFSLLGQPPKKLWDFANIEISAANGGHNALWLVAVSHGCARAAADRIRRLITLTYA